MNIVWNDEQRKRYQKEKTPEQKALYAENLRIKLHAKAVSEGRDPTKVGRPIKLTDEEREASRVRNNKLTAARAAEKRRIVRANKESAGIKLTPGKKSILSPQQRLDARREKYRRWKQKNIEKARARDAELQRERRESIKSTGQYQLKRRLVLTSEERRAVNVAMSHARRARISGAGGTYSPKDIGTLRWRQNGICPCCHMVLGQNDIHVDHWVPLAKGGHNGIDNLRLTHGVCNLKKGTKHPDELRLPYELAA